LRLQRNDAVNLFLTTLMIVFFSSIGVLISNELHEPGIADFPTVVVFTLFVLNVFDQLCVRRSFVCFEEVDKDVLGFSSTGRQRV